MTNLLESIITGESRPTRTLPGDIGNLVVRRLYEEAARQLPAGEQASFRLIASLCQRANEAAQRCLHEEAGKWIGLARELAASLPPVICGSATGFVASNEAFVHFARKDFASTLQCLAASIPEVPPAPEFDPATGTTVSSALIRRSLQRLHFQHLAARTQLAAGDFPGAIASLANATRDADAMALPSGGPELGELLNFMCSRIAGELANASCLFPSSLDYLAATETFTAIGKEGSFSEYRFFRQALVVRKEQSSRRELAGFIELGRMKTSCWYAAVVTAAPGLAAGQQKQLLLRSSAWRDMPAILRSKLVEICLP